MRDSLIVRFGLRLCFRKVCWASSSRGRFPTAQGERRMASRRFSGMVGFLVAGSLVFSSTAAGAAPTLPVPQQVSPWVALTALTGGAPAAALCGSAAIAAQASAVGCVLPVVDVAPPVAQTGPPQP